MKGLFVPLVTVDLEQAHSEYANHPAKENTGDKLDHDSSLPLYAGLSELWYVVVEKESVKLCLFSIIHSSLLR